MFVPSFPLFRRTRKFFFLFPPKPLSAEGKKKKGMDETELFFLSSPFSGNDTVSEGGGGEGGGRENQAPFPNLNFSSSERV